MVFFLPLIGKTINSVIGHPQAKVKVFYEESLAKLKEIKDVNGRNKILTEELSQSQNTELTQYGFTASDANEVKQGIAQLIRESHNKESQLRKELLDLLGKQVKPK